MPFAKGQSKPANSGRKKRQLEIVYWPITRLKPYERNPRKNDQAVDRMVASIKEFGFTVPVLARSSGEVVDGHLRLKAAAKLKLQTLPVILCDSWSEAQVKAFRLLVNRSVGWADWDLEALAQEFAELQEMKFDLTMTGFDTKEIDQFTLQANPAEDDVPPVPETPTSRTGDLWLLGGHRLLCGDATSTEDVARLMGGKRADLALTDPPYGIESVKNGKVGYGNPYGGKKGGSRESIPARNYTAIIGDTEPFDPAGLLLMAREQVIFGGNYFASKLPDGKAWVIWDKNASGTFSPCELAWTSRTGRLHMYRHTWAGLWREGVRTEELTERVHPTQKPVGLFRQILADFSERQHKIIDAYSGSGSTLIACELTERVCFGLEIDPSYTDVIVTRWQNLTGKSATLEGDGRTFEAIQHERFLIKLGAQDEIKEEVLSTVIPLLQREANGPS